MLKKGDLNMSISTIVILILAMTLLGFGLMFIRNTFSSASDQFSNVNSDVQKVLRDRLTQGNERLVLSIDTFELKKGEKKSTEFAIRNDLGQEARFNFSGGSLDSAGKFSGTGGIISCYSSDSDSNNPSSKISFTYPSQIVLGGGEVKVFKWSVSVKSNAVSGATYYCAFVVYDNITTTSGTPYARVDFSVTVK
ncbi:MAG: hypothetical protein QXR30_00080 [Candidatus Woesearchaeota archaeon]